ncbi:MAG: CHASE3 domain-containing protein [Gammaproteobacteria bacterium]|nr:CHASE3 domain-containing protein [Gammaproteobacteria bacterium]
MSSLARQMLVVALLLATVLVLFIAAQVGQRRLEEASARIELGAQRRQALAAVLQLVRQAESSQRGYILLGNPDYLAPFRDAAGDITPALQRLDAAFAAASAPARTDAATLRQLCDAKFSEMLQTIELFADRGRAAAVQVIRTDQGAAAMTQIDDLAARIGELENGEALAASRRWQVNRWLSFATTSSALLASAGLLLLLSRLTLRQLRSKELETEQLTVRQGELERLVEQRTEELSELSSHLQSVAEQEKSALSRELHDELGGLLVAARMDLSWLEERIGSDDAEVRGYFRRVQDALQAGFDIKRRVIESLRPTLLDNLGLLAALRWQVSESCERAGLKYLERYPEELPALNSQAAIAVFRIVQEGLANVLKHARARSVTVSLELSAAWLAVRVDDDGIGIPLERLRALRAHGLAAMRQRARALGGQWTVLRAPAGGTRIEVRLPLERVLAAAAATHAAPAGGARVQEAPPAAAAASPLSNSGRR